MKVFKVINNKKGGFSMFPNPINENQIQPVQPIAAEKLKPESSDQIQTAGDTIESDDEPAPVCEGEEFANREEVLTAIEAAYKRSKNLQVKLLNFAKKKIIEEMGKKADARINAEDIVSNAIYRISIGKRKWYKKKVEKIENLILMVIVSLIRIESSIRPDEDNSLYNAYEAGKDSKEKQKNNQRIIHLNYQKNRNEKEHYNNVIDTEGVKDKNLKKFEDEFNFEQISFEGYIELLLEQTENDDNEFFVLDEILNGNKSNIDIADKLGIEVKEVENARKRIKRKVIKLAAK